jgi:uncharacterized protein
MHRLFLDANVLFSAAYNIQSQLLKLWEFKDVSLCTSRYALEEARINLADESQRDRLADLSVALDYFAAQDMDVPLGISLPSKDVPIILAAIEARADFLLTGDFRHFGPYFGRAIKGVVVIPPARYFKIRDREHR